MKNPNWVLTRCNYVTDPHWRPRSKNYRDNNKLIGHGKKEISISDIKMLSNKVASSTLVLLKIAFSLFDLSNTFKHDQLLSTPLTSFSQRQSPSFHRIQFSLSVLPSSRRNISFQEWKGPILWGNIPSCNFGYSPVKLHIDPLLQSPLLLALFSLILPERRVHASILWTFFDILGAWALVSVWRARQNLSESSRDTVVAAR